MKRLYKIATFFMLIFSIGIYVSIKNINSFFSTHKTSEPSLVTKKLITKSTKVLVINFINN